MSRLRYPNISGVVAENPLLAASTTFAVPTTLPAIAPPFILAIIFEYDTVKEDIAWITLHQTGAAIATILRNPEGPTAVDHAQGTKWIHGPTAADFYPAVDFNVKSPAYGAKGGAKKATDGIIMVGFPNTYWQRPTIQMARKRNSFRVTLFARGRFGDGMTRGGRFGGINASRPRKIGNSGRLISAMASLPNVLHSESAGFTSDVVGMLLNITGAGVNGATLPATITQFIDSKNVVFSPPASTNII